MKNLKVILPLILVPMLSACTTMNKRDCESGEWKAAGYGDATGGYTIDKFDSHVKACAKHGFAADKNLYDQGYQEGLQSYCTLNKGISVGEAADEYRGICPVETEGTFVTGYIRGLNISLEDIDLKRKDLEASLADMRERRQSQETLIVQKNLNDEVESIEAKLSLLRSERSEISAMIAKWIDKASN